MTLNNKQRDALYEVLRHLKGIVAALTKFVEASAE